MNTNLKKRNKLREKRIKRVRKKVFGTPFRPRLTVYRSNKYIYAQIIDDTKSNTLVSVSSLQKEIKEQLNGKTKDKKAAALIGKIIAEKALKLGIDKVVFDRRFYRYHGRIKALADSAREAGLKF